MADTADLAIKVNIDGSALATGIEKVKAKLNSLNAKVKKFGADFKEGFAEGIAEVKAERELNQTAKSMDKVSNSAKRLKKEVSGAGQAIGNAKSNILKFIKAGLGIGSLAVVFSKLKSAIKEGVNNLVQVDGNTNASISNLVSALAQLKNALATAFAPILNVVAPILTKFVNMLTAVATKVAQFMAVLTGKSTYMVATKVNIDYAKSLDKSASSAKKAEKAQKKYLSSLDEIKTWEKEAKEEAKDSAGAGGGISPADMFKEVPVDDNWITRLASKIRSIFDDLKKRAGELKQKFKEGFEEGFKSDKLPKVIENLKEIGNIAKRIWNNPELSEARRNFEDSTAKMLGKVVGATASIGTSLAYGITEGAKQGLTEAEPFIVQKGVEIYNNLSDANTALGDFAETLAEIAQTAFESDSFVSIVKKLTELGTWAMGQATDAIIGFFKDMVHWFVDPITENGDLIAEVLTDIFDILDLLLPEFSFLLENAKNYNDSWFHKWIEEMISDRTERMRERLEKLRDRLVFLKEAIQEIKKYGLLDWFKQNFTWESGWKAVAQGFIGGFVGFLNHIIDKINAFTFSGAREALGNVIGGGLGSVVGSRIPHIPVPALATGAVIPPNAPFMAMLGDQRTGNNLEAPEGLIRQIIREESGRGANYEFVAQINRKTLFDEFIAEAKLRQTASGRNPLLLT